MKKTLMSAVAMIFAVGALSAQSPWFLGGNLGFEFDKDAEKTKTTAFTINPEVGYMFNDNWGITLGLKYSTASQKIDGGDSETDFSRFGVALGAIYKYQIVDNIFYAPTFKVGYENESESKSNNITAKLDFLRFEYRPACHWGFNLNFGGLSFNNFSPDEGDSTNNFKFNVGVSTEVGFTYYF